MAYFDKILIANRGEIAIRVMRACQKMGISTVAVYSEADRDALFVRTADEAVFIGAAASSESYLRIDKIIAAAKQTGAQAVHPGYGFLAENAAFAQACAENNIAFIGPTAEAIVKMGSKINAKVLMQAHGVPTVPGYNGENQSDDNLIAEAKRVGFPVLIKSSAGGGGKGMRIVRTESELADSIAAAKREAERSFGDPTLLLERYFDSAKHIEIQIIGDQHGNVLYCNERECSIQRRYQKIIEEAPSNALSPELRAKMGADAVKAAKAIGYSNAGTVEFIMDASGNYYFLEVNTRLQVEHPVTEEITGLDLVRMQIESAMGLPITVNQADVPVNGHAIECRIIAENPDADFAPVSGKIHVWKPLLAEGMRYDSAVESGGVVDIYYDSMFAKVIAHGRSRAEAIHRMDKALKDLVVLGLTNNIDFLRWTLKQPAFYSGQYDTKFIDQNLGAFRDQFVLTDEQKGRLALLATLYLWRQRSGSQEQLQSVPSGWRNNFYQNQRDTFKFGETSIAVEYRHAAPNRFTFYLGVQSFEVELNDSDGVRSVATIDGHRSVFHCHIEGETVYIHTPETGNRSFALAPRFPAVEVEQAAGSYLSAMPGEVIKILVKTGDAVKANDALIIYTSMKMENTLYALEDGVVEDVFVQEKETFPSNKLLLQVKKAD